MVRLSEATRLLNDLVILAQKAPKDMPDAAFKKIVDAAVENFLFEGALYADLTEEINALCDLAAET
jgi:hypothetical protein